MIQLVVLCDSLPAQTYSFDQQNIIIGREGSPGVDIPIPDDTLSDVHITITKIDYRGTLSYTVINTTNDPFCSFNELPFGKRRIQAGDIITLGLTTIRCEQVRLAPNMQSSEDSPVAAVSQETSSTAPLVSKESLDLAEKSSIDIQADIEQPSEKGSGETNIQSSQGELPQKNLPPFAPTVATLSSVSMTTAPTAPEISPADVIVANTLPADEPAETISENTEDIPPIFFKGPKLSIKDDYLREYDDESETNPFRRRERGLNDYNSFLHAPKSWPMIVKFLAASVGALAVVMGLLYMNVRDQSNTEEIDAAKGVADVAMALAYAQVRHIQPQSHNWSEPEFVKNNLMAVLAPDNFPLAEFDTHGQFTGCPYMLRIYTGSDLTNFIVIAQPAPSILQWLIPKGSIVLNSNSMEIRRIYDLKTINRLLVNASTLDVKEDKELMALISKGELIPLSELVSKTENQGFSPPKTLSMMHPGAENYVYNAPRYYPMGENFIDQMIAIFDKPSSNHDIFMVQQELNVLNRFPHLLLYTSKGIEHAMQAQKALTMLAPGEKFLLAYTQVNSKGKIMGTHILIDEFAEATDGDGVHEEVAFNDIQKKKPMSLINSNFATSTERNSILESVSHQEQVANMSDPFMLQLTALITSRTLTLKPLSDEINSLITSNTQNWNPQFSQLYAKASAKYAKVDEEQREKITNALGTFMLEHRHLPASRFLEYVTAARATPYFQGYLDNIKDQSKPIDETKQMVEEGLQEITSSMSWATLEQSVAKTGDLLNFETIPDTTLLVQYQNELSSKVIQKLNQLLLSSDQSLKPESFTSETHDTLTRILELAWIEDPETQRFYLSEFEMHRR